jgi:hypothetical protein
MPIDFTDKVRESRSCMQTAAQIHHFNTPPSLLTLSLPPLTQLFEFNGSTFQVQQNDQSSDYIGELM